MKRKSPYQHEMKALLKIFDDNIDQFDLFRRQVGDFFQSKPFTSGPLPLVHSVKSRLKDRQHVEKKILRKWSECTINPNTFFNVLTDIAGVRVLHLHTAQFPKIHAALGNHIINANWAMFEPPTAYSWDPEATAFFRDLGINAVTRDSYYTSIHYVVRPHANSQLTCEIQIRTLFEEAWGEIDHAINYPIPTTLIACREQLRVLAKLSSTGTRLADAIFRTAQSAADLRDA